MVILMKKLSLVILLLLIPIVSALETDELLDDMGKIKTNFNENFEAPGFFKALFGEEKINLHITLDDGEVLVVGISMENSKITTIKDVALESPTLNAYAGEEVMDKILYSEDPFSELKKGLDNDEVTYKATTIKSKVKYGVAGLLATVVGWFS